LGVTPKKLAVLANGDKKQPFYTCREGKKMKNEKIYF
jgi:hypothetical protein